MITLISCKADDANQKQFLEKNQQRATSASQQADQRLHDLQSERRAGGQIKHGYAAITDATVRCNLTSCKPVVSNLTPNTSKNASSN